MTRLCRLITYLDHTNLENIRISNNSNYNIDIGIASAITAYSRIVMSRYKNNFNLTGNLYYTDTDSIFIDKELDLSLVNSDIGKFKLENVYSEICFLSPKVYGGITIDGNEIVKVKGFKNKLPFIQLKSLLTKDQSLLLNHSKWYKSFENGIIKVKNETYNLIVTENKRKLVYENNTLIKTIPYIINNKEIINS